MYIKRDAEVQLKKFADQYPVVTLTGPRQSGKTTICQKSFPVEIKSASTFNDSFAKNLEYFSQFHYNEKIGSVIYTGKTQKRTKYDVLNYEEFFKILYKLI